MKLYHYSYEELIEKSFDKAIGSETAITTVILRRSLTQNKY